MTAAWAALASCSVEPRSTLVNATSTVVTSVGPLDSSSDNSILHLLRRTSFGPTVDELEHIQAIGVDAYLDEQLNPDMLDDTALDLQLAQFDLLNVPSGELFARVEREEVRPPEIIGQMIAATLLRQVYSKRQLFEVMVDFWSNHFNIAIGEAPLALTKPTDDREVIRAHALGRFRDLLSASAHSAAMLIYLDNANSTRNGPNENYAREIMELHTLGVNGGYTQKDVAEVARAFTGWSIVLPREARRSAGEMGSFLFRERAHDDGPKSILDVDFPRGQGLRDGEQVIDILASHPSTAETIARKLCVRFVSDVPPDSVISKAANTFTQTEGDIRAVLRTILTSEEFAASVGQKVKRPLEFFSSVLRSTNAELELGGNRQRGRVLMEQVKSLGQVPFFWPTPDGYPDTAVHWLNNGAMLARWNFALALISGQLRIIRPHLEGIVDDVDSFEEALDRVSLRLLGQHLPADAKSIVLDFVKAVPDDVKLRGAVALILGSPHFQVR